VRGDQRTRDRGIGNLHHRRGETETVLVECAEQSQVEANVLCQVLDLERVRSSVAPRRHQREQAEVRHIAGEVERL